MKIIFVHGSGHKAISWKDTVSHIKCKADVLCPDLSSLLNGKEATYENLYASFVEYCEKIDEQFHLCGISLGGILGLNYALDFPKKVKSLVLIGTPHKVPKVAFTIQNVFFKLFPKSVFYHMAFDKKNTFALGNSMKNLDFSSSVQNIQCPTMIVCGKKDNSNIKSAYYLSQNIKNSQLKIIENTGHVVNEENPKVLAQILDEFYIKAF